MTCHAEYPQGCRPAVGVENSARFVWSDGTPASPAAAVGMVFA